MLVQGWRCLHHILLLDSTLTWYSPVGWKTLEKGTDQNQTVNGGYLNWLDSCPMLFTKNSEADLPCAQQQSS